MKKLESESSRRWSGHRGRALINRHDPFVKRPGKSLFPFLLCVEDTARRTIFEPESGSLPDTEPVGTFICSCPAQSHTGDGMFPTKPQWSKRASQIVSSISCSIFKAFVCITRPQTFQCWPIMACTNKNRVHYNDIISFTMYHSHCNTL